MRNRSIIAVNSDAKKTKWTILVVAVMVLIFSCPLNAYDGIKNPDSIDVLVARQAARQEQYEDNISKIVEQSKDSIQAVVDKSAEKKDIVCLAKNIYFESRNQPYTGQVMVAFVTLNRSKLVDQSPCKVVYQRSGAGKDAVCQFTWTCELGTKAVAGDKETWHESLVLAYITYHNQLDDISGNALYYFNYHAVHPVWCKNKIPIQNAYISNGYMGDHRFFTLTPQKLAEGNI